MTNSPACVPKQTLRIERPEALEVLNYMGVSKNCGKNPKIDGENNVSKPYEQMDDLGGNFTPYF